MPSLDNPGFLFLLSPESTGLNGDGVGKQSRSARAEKENVERGKREVEHQGLGRSTWPGFGWNELSWRGRCIQAMGVVNGYSSNCSPAFSLGGGDKDGMGCRGSHIEAT